MEYPQKIWMLINQDGISISATEDGNGCFESMDQIRQKVRVGDTIVEYMINDINVVQEVNITLKYTD